MKYLYDTFDITTADAHEANAFYLACQSGSADAVKFLCVYLDHSYSDLYKIGDDIISAVADVRVLKFLYDRFDLGELDEWPKLKQNLD